MRSVVLLLLMVPSVLAQGSAVDADLDVRGGVEFQGRSELDLRIGGSMLDDRDDKRPTGHLTLNGSFTYTYYEIQERYFISHTGSPAGTRRMDAPDEVRELSSGRLEGQVETSDLDAEFSLRIVPDADASVPWGGDLRLGPVANSTAHYESRSSPAAAESPLPRSGSRWTPQEPVAYESIIRVHLYGTQVQAQDGQVFATGEMDREAVSSPDGSMEVVEARHRILVLEGHGEADHHGEWVHWIRGASGRLDGDLELIDATGRASVNDTQDIRNPDLFHAKGVFHVDADHRTMPAHWTVEGDAWYAAVNAAVIFQSEGVWAAAAGVAGLALVWLWLSRFGQSVLVWVGLRVFDEDQEVRRRILESVHDEGGVHKSELCRRLERGWGTVSHHLRVLRDSKDVKVETLGRKRWVFRPDLSERERRLIATLRHDDRMRLIKLLDDHGHATVPHLAGVLGASAKTLRTHLLHLQDAGIIERRDGSPHRYSIVKETWTRCKRLLDHLQATEPNPSSEDPPDAMAK